LTRAWHAVVAYTVLSIVVTWPLARGLGRDVPSDLGDPVLNLWIIAWDCEQLLAILRGEVSRAATFFDANVFHPAPLALAFSEHLIPQALQALPVYAVSNNPILAYNVVFLLTFILSGLGMFLFVRELTGNYVAGLVAGLLFAFAPYRFPQAPHIQVLSSQWMPFVLYGLRRFFVAIEAGERGWKPLIGASVSLVLQCLSCGYYLLYFPPFAAAYAVWEIGRRGLWRRAAIWGRLAGAALLVSVSIAPFLLPYAAVRRDLGFVRESREVIRYSADVHSYATAASTFWSPALRAFPKPEGDLFPGAVAVLLTVAGLWIVLRSVSRPVRERRRWFVLLLGSAALFHAVAAFMALIHRRVLLDLWLFELQISNVNQMILRAGVLTAILVAISPTARQTARLVGREHGFFLLGWLVAAWLSLGPLPQAGGRPVEIAAPYAFLYEQIPGFEGVRVPARFAMICVFMLAATGGLGAAAMAGRRWTRTTLALLAAAILVEGAIVPFPVNVSAAMPGFNSPEPRLHRPGRAPGVYHELAKSPDVAAVAELPLGQEEFDLRAMYYSLVHDRPVLNGYSGFIPRHYGSLTVALSDVVRQPEAALAALRTYGATHVVVHESAYAQNVGTQTTATLVARGATELYRDGGDVLLRLP
jgi:hypothetical protein